MGFPMQEGHLYTLLIFLLVRHGASVPRDLVFQPTGTENENFFAPGIASAINASGVVHGNATSTGSTGDKRALGMGERVTQAWTEVFEVLNLGRVFLSAETHTVVLDLGTQIIETEIIKFKGLVRDTEPSKRAMRKIKGVEKEYLVNSYPMSGQDGALKCEELSGSVLKFRDLNHEELLSNITLIAGDVFYVGPNTISCEIHGIAKSGVDCVKMLKYASDGNNMHFLNV